jgi:hypothetical protein
MIPATISPVRFWPMDPDSIEIKIDDLDDLALAGSLFAAEDNLSTDIMIVSPIKSEQVLKLFRQLKRSRTSQIASAQKRKIQSVKINQLLDDITKVAETPTRLSISRSCSAIPLLSMPSPESPTQPSLKSRNPFQKQTPSKVESELKYLFEVMGVSSPYLCSPTPAALEAMKASGKSPVKLCTAEQGELLDLLSPKPSRGASVVTGEQRVSPARPKTPSRIPTPARLRRSEGGIASDYHHSGEVPTSSARLSAPGAVLRAETPRGSQTTAAAEKTPQAVAHGSPRPARIASAVRSPRTDMQRKAIQSVTPSRLDSAASRLDQLRSPIRLAASSRKTASTVERPTTPARQSTFRDRTSRPNSPDPTSKRVPAYMRETASSRAAASPSPPRLADTLRSPMAHSAGKKQSVQSPRRISPARSLAVASPNVTVRQSPVAGSLEAVPFNAENEKPVQNRQGGSISASSEQAKVSGVIRSANKKLFMSPPISAKNNSSSESAYFDSILASCDDILSQLDAAVTRCPKTAVML